jgi:hypothetical protein
VAIARAHFYFNLPTTLLTIVAGALLTYAVYSRWTARPRAKQARRPEKKAADRRRKRQAGAAAEATPDEAQVDTNRARVEEEAAKHKAAKAEAAALAAAEKAAAAAKARAAAAVGNAAREAAAEKAAARAAAKQAVAEKAAEGRAAAAEAAKAAATAAVALDRPSSLPVMSLATAQFDTGRPVVPESTIGGQTTCIICFVNPKSHIAVPCGHQCACGDCSAEMNECPVCRASCEKWVHVRVA